MPRIIIPAGGRGTRWKNFRGTAKHMAIVNDEILIHRTIKQFSQYSDDIIVVSRDPYNIPATVEDPLDIKSNDIAKIWSSNHLWSNTKRNILVFGDVWFSDEAVEKIMENKDPIQFFMRTGPSRHTGKPYKEIFAVAFDGEKIEFVRNLIYKIIADNKRGAGAYLLFKEINNLENVPPRHHFDNKQSFVEIDDFTDDFDHPIDLVRWEKRFKARRKIER